MTASGRTTGPPPPQTPAPSPSSAGLWRETVISSSIQAGTPTRPTIDLVLRRDDADAGASDPVRSSPAGASPVSVSAGAPSTRPQACEESRTAQAGCQEPLRREPVRGPQHHVKLAASSNLQPEPRAGHGAAKTTPVALQSGDVQGHSAGYGAQHADTERSSRANRPESPMSCCGRLDPKRHRHCGTSVSSSRHAVHRCRPQGKPAPDLNKHNLRHR